MIRPVTIQARLLAIFVVAAAIPLAVVSILSYHNSIEAVERMVGNRTSRLASSVGEELSRKFRGRLGDRILLVNEPVQKFLRVSESGSAQARKEAELDLQNYATHLFEEYGRYYREMILADAGGTPLYRYGRSKGSSRVAMAVQSVRDAEDSQAKLPVGLDSLATFMPEELPLPGLAEQVEAFRRGIQAQFEEQKQIAKANRDRARAQGVETPPIPPTPGEPTLPPDVVERLTNAFSRAGPEVRDPVFTGPDDPRFGVSLDLDRRRFTEEENLAARTGSHLGPNESMVVLAQGATGQNEAVRLIRPVFSVNEPSRRLGVLILDLRVDYLFPEDLAGERFGTKGELAVVNQGDGEVLFHTTPELVGQKLRIAAPVLAGAVERQGEYAGPPWFEFREEGVHRIAARFPVEAVPWMVLATSVPREFGTEVREAGYANLVVASAAALLAFGFLLFSSRKISRSVHVVTEGAREITAGNLRHTIFVESRDEIQTLAETFNAMTASLRENIKLRENAKHELEALNRTLEDRVSERTRELQALNEALNHANQELKELDRLKSNFLATVSHEFKTPLTSITAFSEILLDEMTEKKQSPEVLRFLNIINNESGRLGRLIRNLLDLSRIEAGRMRWEHSVFPIQEVLGASLDGLLPVFSEKDIDVHRDVHCPGARIDADRDRIQQVITNLIENAVKFSEKGSSVWIACRESPSSRNGKEFLELVVRDEGPGIPDSQLVRIFERFHQVDNTETRGTGGSGLGLAISKEIVEHHGGTIWVESLPGQGAAFHFTIPFLREDEHG